MSMLTSLVVPALAFIGIVGVARADEADNTVYVATYVDVMPASLAEGMAAIKSYRAAIRNEPGSRHVDALSEPARPGRFVIIEIWQDQASFETHQKSGSTARFRETTAVLQHSPPDQRVHRGFMAVPAAASGAVYVVTHVDVIPPRQAETEAALRRLAETSRRDPGNARYDVFQQTARPNHFTIYAVWKTAADFDAHERSPHRLAFRETLAPLLGALYDERIFAPLE